MFPLVEAILQAEIRRERTGPLIIRINRSGAGQRRLPNAIKGPEVMIDFATP